MTSIRNFAAEAVSSRRSTRNRNNLAYKIDSALVEAADRGNLSEDETRRVNAMLDEANPNEEQLAEFLELGMTENVKAALKIKGVQIEDVNNSVFSNRNGVINLTVLAQYADAKRGQQNAI